MVLNLLHEVELFFCAGEEKFVDFRCFVEKSSVFLVKFWVNRRTPNEVLVLLRVEYHYFIDIFTPKGL